MSPRQSHSVHAGSAFAGDAERCAINVEWETTCSVHDGKHFAEFVASYKAETALAIRRGRTPRPRPLNPLSISVPARKVCRANTHWSDLTDDAIVSVIALLDLRDIISMRCVSSATAPLARGALDSMTRAERFGALIVGSLPAVSPSLEREAAAALVLQSKSIPQDDGWAAAFYKLANSTISQVSPSLGAIGWVLTREVDGADGGHDLSFELRGFDDRPLCKRPEVVEWHAAHLPDRPLLATHLPCVLAGPPRYLSLAGSLRQQRKTTRVPMELCRIIRAPTSGACCHGVALITALIERSRSASIQARLQQYSQRSV